MPTAQDYKNAQKVIEEFNNQLVLEFVKPVTCICCGTKIQPLMIEHTSDPAKLDESWWDDGTVSKINPGYGSRHDLSSFFIGICDNCLDKAIQSGIAISQEQLKYEIKQRKEL